MGLRRSCMESFGMLRIYSDVQALQGEARGMCERIRRYDIRLADQLRRAAQAVALNMAEGMAARDGMRRRAYRIALGEARECLGAIDVAERWGYLRADARVVDRLDKIVGTLVRLTGPAK